MSSQLPLPLALAPHARFETFVTGANASVVHELSAPAAGLRKESLWLWGADGLGKSHLLQAACAARPDRRVIYVPLAELADRDPGLLEGLESFDLIALVHEHLERQEDQDVRPGGEK